MKICTKCKTPKDESEFFKKKGTKDGLNQRCKVCTSEINKQYPETEENKQYRKEFYQNNKEIRKPKNQAYYKNNKDKIDKQSREWFKNNPLRYKYTAYKNAAKKRNIGFNLTEEEFYSFAGKECYYCNDKIENIGIDRIDSLQEYRLDNCVSCCSMCNKMKMEFSYEKFINQVKKIWQNIERLKEI